MKDVLNEKKIVGSIVVNSAVEESYYQFKGENAIKFIVEALQKLQIVALVEENDIENFKELRNKKISSEISSNIRNNILN